MIGEVLGTVAVLVAGYLIARHRRRSPAAPDDGLFSDFDDGPDADSGRHDHHHQDHHHDAQHHDHHDHAQDHHDHEGADWEHDPGDVGDAGDVERD